MRVRGDGVLERGGEGAVRVRGQAVVREQGAGREAGGEEGLQAPLDGRFARREEDEGAAVEVEDDFFGFGGRSGGRDGGEPDAADGCGFD